MEMTEEKARERVVDSLETLTTDFGRLVDLAQKKVEGEPLSREVAERLDELEGLEGERQAWIAAVKDRFEVRVHKVGHMGDPGGVIVQVAAKEPIGQSGMRPRSLKADEASVVVALFQHYGIGYVDVE